MRMSFFPLSFSLSSPAFEKKLQTLTISLHGSNSEYLADLENTFCAAPTKTAAIRGVSPYLASIGEKASPPRTSAKNATPVASSTVGVMIAAPPLEFHLFLLLFQRERRAGEMGRGKERKEGVKTSENNPEKWGPKKPNKKLVPS